MPDFQQFYGLRLSDVVLERDPTEVLLLVQGLPEEARFHARLMGDGGMGWSLADWVLLDLRNVAEGIRSGFAEKPREAFRKWDQFPGAERARRRANQARFDQVFSLLEQKSGVKQ